MTPHNPVAADDLEDLVDDDMTGDLVNDAAPDDLVDDRFDVGVDDRQDLVDLSHLHPGARAIARLPAQERLRHLRADRWIGYSRATVWSGWRSCSAGRASSGCRTCC